MWFWGCTRREGGGGGGSWGGGLTGRANEGVEWKWEKGTALLVRQFGEEQHVDVLMFIDDTTERAGADVGQQG